MEAKHNMSKLIRILSGVACVLLAGEANAEKQTQCGATPSDPEMVLIKGGVFAMGDTAGEGDARPVRKVRVDDFLMDAHEVTQASYTALMTLNPSRFVGPKLPVERTRWTDAARYCNVRSKQEGLAPCYDEETWGCDFAAKGYRLPTEAEWEYASRAGGVGNWYFTDKNKLDQHAWLRINSGKKTHAVGTRRPNALGLYDMYGNVSEWCNDFYAEDYYAKGENNNPKGPARGEKRVLRGGSWDDRESKCDSVMRQKDAPTTADICQGYDTYGFRCVRTAD